MSIIGDIAYNPTTAQANPRTGDSRNFVDKKVNGVMFMNFPVVDVMRLSHKHLDINNHQKSGKDEGTLVIAHTESVPLDTEDFALYAATGKLDTDKWAIVKQIVNKNGQTPMQDILVSQEEELPTEWEYKNTGDSFYILEEAYEGVNFASMARVRKAHLDDAVQPINDSSISGKKVGAMVVAYDREREHSALYVATGSNPVDPWVRLVSLQIKHGETSQHATYMPPKITPVNRYSPTPLPVTGDGYKQTKDKQYVYLHAMPVYDFTPFEDQASPENTQALSGKSLGSMTVLTRTNEHERKLYTHKALYISTGKGITDKWVKLIDLVAPPEDQSSNPLPAEITPTNKGDS